MCGDHLVLNCVQYQFSLKKCLRITFISWTGLESAKSPSAAHSGSVWVQSKTDWSSKLSPSTNSIVTALHTSSQNGGNTRILGFPQKILKLSTVRYRTISWNLTVKISIVASFNCRSCKRLKMSGRGTHKAATASVGAGGGSCPATSGKFAPRQENFPVFAGESFCL